MKSILLIFCAAAALASCSAPRTPSVPQGPSAIKLKTTSFDSELAKKLISEGTNTVKGNAFMRQSGGGVVTCAGSEVRLIPATEYAKNRMDVLYGPAASAYRGIEPILFDPEIAEYATALRSTKCDAQGNFQFDKVADGDFFVQTMVVWQVGYRPQGGGLMHRISVRNGQVVNLILSA